MDGGMPRSGFKCSVFDVESCFISHFGLDTKYKLPSELLQMGLNVNNICNMSFCYVYWHAS